MITSRASARHHVVARHPPAAGGGAGLQGAGARRSPLRLVALGVAAALVAACAGTDPGVDDADVPPPAPVPAPGTDADADGPIGGAEPTPPDTGDEQPPAQPLPGPDLAAVEVALAPAAVMGAPIAATVGPRGEVLVADRRGTVHELTDDGIGPPLVDLSAETTTDGERGLLGIALAADRSELYLSYTDLEGTSRLDAVAVVDGELVADRRRAILSVPQPFSNHNGGDVQVGPDGRVYLALGDGGGAGDPLEAGQDLTSPLGALLRIDPAGADPYAVPDDNPFLDVPGAAPEIVAYGLRNPWRFSFDPVTDEVWIADVGQDRLEEINRLGFSELVGANLGWNLREGSERFTGDEPEDHVPPVYEYATRGPEGCAVTGGLVYRGSSIPALVGAYLYADACNGELRALHVDVDGRVVEQAWLGVDAGRVVGFAADADGEVLVLDLSGTVHRLLPG